MEILKKIRREKYLQGLFLAVCFVLITTHQLIQHSKYSKGVNRLKFKDYTWEKSHLSCHSSVPYSELNKSFVVCGLNNDLYVASFFKKYQKFEPVFMELMSTTLIKFPESVFVDIGSNIGTYSLMARSLGHSVISVDPMIRNHGMLFNSLALNNFDDGHEVTQILNAVSDSYTSMDSQQPNPYNFGNIIMKQIKDGEISNPEKVINSVKFQDILDLVPENKTVILKIDVEGYECKALSNFLSSEVKTRYIPYMLVETWNICDDVGKLCPGFEDIFLKSLEQSGYIPYIPQKTTYERLKSTKYDCAFNTLFVHKSADWFHISVFGEYK